MGRAPGVGFRGRVAHSKPALNLVEGQGLALVVVDIPLRNSVIPTEADRRTSDDLRVEGPCVFLEAMTSEVKSSCYGK